MTQPLIDRGCRLSGSAAAFAPAPLCIFSLEYPARQVRRPRMGERPPLQHLHCQPHVGVTEHRSGQLDRQLRTRQPSSPCFQVRTGCVRYRPRFRPRMSRDVAIGLEFRLARVISRRFATARYLGGIFESYRWSNSHKAS